MTITVEGEEYLTKKESRLYLGIGSDITFDKVAEEYRLKAYDFPGKGRRIFFKRTDLDKLKLPRPREE